MQLILLLKNNFVFCLQNHQIKEQQSRISILVLFYILINNKRWLRGLANNVFLKSQNTGQLLLSCIRNLLNIWPHIKLLIKRRLSIILIALNNDIKFVMLIKTIWLIWKLIHRLIVFLIALELQPMFWRAQRHRVYFLSLLLLWLLLGNQIMYLTPLLHNLIITLLI